MQEKDYVNVGTKIGCLMFLIFGGCITGCAVALTIKFITWLFGL